MQEARVGYAAAGLLKIVVTVGVGCGVQLDVDNVVTRLCFWIWGCDPDVVSHEELGWPQNVSKINLEQSTKDREREREIEIELEIEIERSRERRHAVSHKTCFARAIGSCS